MRGFSLCTGIGGLDLAAQAAGVQVVGMSEIDPFCRTLLAQRFPTVALFNDMKDLTGEEISARCGVIDLLFGGIPCQPWSSAGRQRGVQDSRDLWPDTLRLVRELRPAWVVIENVRNFVNLALERVTMDLEAENYEVGSFVLPASAIGAPHKRERVFVVAHTDRLGRERRQEGFARRDQYAGECAGQKAATQSQAAGQGTGTNSPAGEAVLARPLAHPQGARRTVGGHRGRTQSLGSTSHDGAGNSGAHSLANSAGAGLPLAGCAKQPTKDTQGEGRMESESQRCGCGKTECRLGRDTYGIPGWLDRPFPAGRGAFQYAWEPSRTVTERVPNRTKRLKALGNAVVSQQAYPIFAALMVADFMEKKDRRQEF